VLGVGTALSGTASELLELCEVVARADCGVIMVGDRRSDGPDIYAERQLRLYAGRQLSLSQCSLRLPRVFSRRHRGSICNVAMPLGGAWSVLMMMAASGRFTVGEDVTCVRLLRPRQFSGTASASAWSSWLSSGAS
jgi:hypothetical protein